MIEEHSAKVVGKFLPISTKFSVEMCRYIKKKPLAKAVVMVRDVLDMKRALPIIRFNKDCAHKPGKMAAGRYPQKVSKEFLNLLNTLEKNAENKGLDINSLVINYASASIGVARWHPGRKRRRQFKNTHVEIRAVEVKEEKPKVVKKVKKVKK